MSALTRQHGGDHYKSKGIQPVEFCAQVRANFFQGAIVKYLTRHRQKNGAEDINKAEHFFELMVALKVNHAPWWHFWRRIETLPAGIDDMIFAYCFANNMTGDEAHVLRHVMRVGDGEKYLEWARHSFRRIREKNGYPVPRPSGPSLRPLRPLRPPKD